MAAALMRCYARGVMRYPTQGWLAVGASFLLLISAAANGTGVGAAPADVVLRPTKTPVATNSPTPTPTSVGATATATATATVGTSVYANTIVADTPLGYWRLGESSGTLAVDGVGAHNATYVNGPLLGQAGALVGDTDTAVKFDGVATNATVGNALNFPNTTAFSLESWVKPSVLDATTRRIISKDNST